MSTVPRFSISFSCILFALAMPACKTWVGEPLTSHQPSPHKERGPVRVTKADGKTVELKDVEVGDDTLIGYTGEPRQRVAIAVAEVKKLEKKGFNASRAAELYRDYLIGVISVAGLAMVIFLR